MQTSISTRDPVAGSSSRTARNTFLSTLETWGSLHFRTCYITFFRPSLYQTCCPALRHRLPWHVIRKTTIRYLFKTTELHIERDDPAGKHQYPTPEHCFAHNGKAGTVLEEDGDAANGDQTALCERKPESGRASQIGRQSYLPRCCSGSRQRWLSRHNPTQHRRR